MDQATKQWLNLLNGSPSFVIRLGDGHPNVQKVPKVPANDGLYWMAGTTKTARGDLIKSVFEVDTDAGGSLTGVYWFIEGKWITSSEKSAAYKALKATEAEIFPFDWEFTVPLEDDMFHG